MSGRLSIIAATACLLVPPLAAQASPSRIIECGTDSRQRVLCAAGGRITTVKLVRDLSFNRCDARGSWGWIEKAVWADNRCRGRFEVSYRSLPGSGTTPGTTRRITCGTLTPRRVTCKTEGYATSVRMVREISFGDRCRQGSTWDNTDSFVWAGNGCRAEFEVTYRDATAPLPAPAPATRSITCGTYSGAQVTCKTDGYATSVRLIRELSNDRCRQGSNWG
ncbi:MAG: DUF3011 domain-containing protein, partial [Gemmatimonadales bacterium]